MYLVTVFIETEKAEEFGSALLCTFIKITLQHGCSPVNLLQIFRTTFPKNTSGRLLLYL